MPSNQVPEIPVGKDPWLTFFNRVSTAIPANRLTKSPGLRVVNTTRGTMLLPETTTDKVFIDDRGEYNADAHYGPGDLITVYPDKTYTSSYESIDTASVGTWLNECIVPDKLFSNTLTSAGLTGSIWSTFIRNPGINYQPTWPQPDVLATDTEDGNGRYWRLIAPFSGSGGGEGELDQCKITWMNSQNYFGAKKWNGTVTSSTEFMVAKSIPSRMPSSATIEGESFSYSYTNDNLRVSTAGDASTELQSMLQQFTVGDVVWVSKCDYTSLTHSGSAIKYIEVNTEREWVRRYSQTPP